MAIVVDTFGMIMILLALFGLMGILAWGKKFLTDYAPAQTIENWKGVGVRDDLTPVEAALLLGKEPGHIYGMFLLFLDLAGKCSVESLHPVTLPWTGGEPEGPYERAFLDSLDEKGRPVEEKVCDFIETLYNGVNEKLNGFSGRKTVIHYRKMVTKTWNDSLVNGLKDRETALWLLLANPEDYVETFRKSRKGRAIGNMFRILGFFSQYLLDRHLIEEKLKRAGSGFFKYRRDLARTFVPYSRDDRELAEDNKEFARSLGELEADVLGFSKEFGTEKERNQEDKI